MQGICNKDSEQWLLWLLLVYLNRLVFFKGIHSSGVLFLYWFFQSIGSSISALSTYRRVEIFDSDIFYKVTIIIELLLVLISFISNCFVDITVVAYHCQNYNQKLQRKLSESINIENSPTSPEFRASFLSKITFFWLNGLLYQGFKRAITIKDLYSLRNGYKCKTIIKTFSKKWTKEILRIQQGKVKEAHTVKKLFSKEYHSVLTHEEETDSIKTLKDLKPSLIRAIFDFLGYKYVLCIFVRIFIDLVLFLQPVLLGLLIGFIENKSDFTWHGYIIVLGMFLISMTKTIIHQQYNHVVNVSGMRLRSAVTSFIYKKVLKISQASGKGSSLGEIVNMMSVDAQRLPSIPFEIHSILSIPITVTVGFYFLWQELGVSTLAGIGLIILIIPLNAIIGMKVKTLQTEQMRLKDIRIKWMSEILSGMTVLKLYAWENSFEDRIKTIRNKECRLLRLSTYMNSLSAISCFCAPYLIALCSFATFIFSNPSNILDSNKTFVSLSLINLLSTPMSYLPTAIVFVIQTYVSMRRINMFLIKEELDLEDARKLNNNGNSIEIVNGTFSWGRGNDIVLKNINMKIPEGSLVAIVGTVGSGKSSLINAILGEMYTVNGNVFKQGSVAYVPQQPWCQNTTIQKNIIFGKPLSLKGYENVIRVCALIPDIEMLPGRDQTKVGERGINLSGGQKQRISIARALYQDASIYILDSPLSAVDAHVNKHIFDKVIGRNGILYNKTRILVTHDITHLPKVDIIYMMKNGKIIDCGTYDDLLDKGGEFSQFIKLFIEQEEKKKRTTYERNIKKRNDSLTEREKLEEIQRNNHLRRKSSQNRIIQDHSGEELMDDEFVENDAVKLDVFLSYLRPVTYPIILLILLSYGMYLISSVSANIFISSWSELNSQNSTQEFSNRNKFLLVYGGFGLLQTLFILIENLYLAQGTFLASKSIHANLLKTLFRAQNSFFENTPIGRILNRIGKDIDIVDVNVPTSIAAWLITASGVIGTIVVISIVTPYFLLSLIPLSILYSLFQKFYISTNRQLKRIDSITRSPIYSHFHETITGVASIRAYNKSEEFMDKCDSLIDKNQRAWYLSIVSFRWLQLNLEFLGNLIILFSGIFVVLIRDSIGAGMAGLSVTYALQITGSLNNMVRNGCDLESHIVSVERIMEYTNIKEEAPLNILSTPSQSKWPLNGKVEFRNYSMKYRPELKFVLKNLNFKVNPGEKLGIVGRTGAGKSSLVLALFRLIEATEGCIFIDDVDISKLGLHEVRNKITIIPQDPVIFSGTLRMNLDPFDQYSDEEIWKALELSYIKPFVINMQEGLEFEVSERGDNLSSGQKQLICLARALLKKTKILVLDEATAAVDLETDSLIQISIRRQFRSCTVLTIAHRLNTIMDYDRVLVLEDGQIKEVGIPQSLLTDKKSIFSKLANDAGLI